MKITQELTCRTGGVSVNFALDLTELTLQMERDGEVTRSTHGTQEELLATYEDVVGGLFASDAWVDERGHENQLLDIEAEVERAALPPVEQFGQSLVDQTRAMIVWTREVAGDDPVQNAVLFFDGYRCRRVEYNAPELPFEGEGELRRLSWNGLEEEGVTARVERDGPSIDLASFPAALAEVLGDSLQLYDVTFVMSWVCAQLEPEFGFDLYVTLVEDGSFDFGSRQAARVGEPLESFIRRRE